MELPLITLVGIFMTGLGAGIILTAFVRKG